jgi:hypothetical protein
MSTISAISNWNQNLSQLAAEFTGQPASTTSTTANSLSGTVTASPSTLAGALGQTQGKHHKHGKLFKQIEQSVTSALQSASPTADPNKVVQDAIAKVLSDSSASSQATVTSDADADSDGTQQTFVQTLQAFGITPDQFKNDLTAAMQSARGGNAGGATVSSFPPGLFLDTAG